MLWGVTTERVQEWAREADGGRAHGAAASPGIAEGPARVVRTVDQIGDVRDGEILVCSDHLARVGADLLQHHRHRDRHRRRDVARGDRLPRVRAARGGRHRPGDRRSAPAAIRVDGSAAR